MKQNFSDNTTFVTGARNGTISLWKNKKVEMSMFRDKISNEWTLVHHKNGRIFAASKNKDVVELNMDLNTVKKFQGRDSQPYTMDADKRYLIVGYKNGYVDVHCRDELDQNGMYRKISVSFPRFF